MKLREFYQQNFCKNMLLKVIKHVTGMEKLDVLCKMDEYVLSQKQEALCRKLLMQLKEDKPWSKIVNKQTFCELEFFVNEHVLDPRPETEQILAIAPKATNVLDLGTGSGCLLVSLLKKFDCKGIGVDVCIQALEVAKQNAKTHQVNATLIQSDWWENVPSQKFDLIVANPPYVAKDEEIGKEVLLWDPGKAVFADEDGFEHYEKILMRLHEFANGCVIFEVPTRLRARFLAFAKQLKHNFVWHESNVANIGFAVCDIMKNHELYYS